MNAWCTLRGTPLSGRQDEIYPFDQALQLQLLTQSREYHAVSSETEPHRVWEGVMLAVCWQHGPHELHNSPLALTLWDGLTYLASFINSPGVSTFGSREMLPNFTVSVHVVSRAC